MTTTDPSVVPVRHGFLHSEDEGLRTKGYPEWDRLRNETPVFESDYATPGSPQPIWYFLDYDDVYAILRDTGMYSSEGFTHPELRQRVHDDPLGVRPAEAHQVPHPDQPVLLAHPRRPDGAGHPLGLPELLEELAPSGGQT